MNPQRRLAPLLYCVLLAAAAGGAAAPFLSTTRAFADEPAKPTAEDVKIATPRGVALVGTVNRPAKASGIAVVLAPGQGYDRTKRLMVRCAEALAEAGFVAVRFDWAYFTAKGQPSEGLANEAEDFEAAISHARSIEGVKKVIVAGKSLGSMVALKRAAKRSDDLLGLALLTFPIADGATLREGVDAGARLSIPVVIVNGDTDPLCPLAFLYKLVAEWKTPPSICIVPGDHGLQGATKADAETAENVDLAARALVLWARRR
jgi:predicted alpha/beta-hydrolase family hydrolase